MKVAEPCGYRGEKGQTLSTREGVVFQIGGEGATMMEFKYQPQLDLIICRTESSHNNNCNQNFVTLLTECYET